MSKKDELTAFLPPVVQPIAPAMTPPKRDAAIIKREQAVQYEAYIQYLVTRYQSIQLNLSLQQIEQIHITANVVVTETLDTIAALTQHDGYRSKDDQEYIDRFRMKQRDKVVRDVNTVLDASIANIVAEIQRTLYAPPEPEPKSFLKRLFGG